MTYKQNQLNDLYNEIERTLRQKAMIEFEEHRTFYPPIDGWTEWTWDNEETGETLTQAEAFEMIETKIGEYAQEMETTIIQAIMDA